MIANWVQFERMVDLALGGAEGQPMALIHVHIRRLRSLRALVGQPAAERAQEEALGRVKVVLRPQDCLMRLGEADLLLALPKLLSPGHARLAAQSVQRALGAVLEVEGMALRLQPELGIALFPQHGETALQLQRAASLAVERARNTPSGMAEAGGPVPETLYAELRSALQANMLTVEFQPLMRLRDGRCIGYEALARWRHPVTQEPVPPSVFVTLAEDAGLASELTRWGLQAALREFRPLYAANPELHCAVNLSARAFDDSALREQIESALALWDLPPSALLVEITETALLSDPQCNARQLSGLREIGVQIAIDDFGQGYSSFGYLQYLEVGTLKIDRRFLERLEAPRESGLVLSMIQLAHRLDMQVVAEGVETEEVHRRLCEFGCDHAQGWLYGRSAPAAQWMATPPRAPAAR